MGVCLAKRHLNDYCQTLIAGYVGVNSSTPMEIYSFEVLQGEGSVISAIPPWGSAHLNDRCVIYTVLHLRRFLLLLTTLPAVVGIQ